jgi:hypothetical protein
MFPSFNPSDELGLPILYAGSRLCLHGLSFIHAITLEQGVLVHGLHAH